MKRLALAAGVAAIGVAPALADPITFGGRADVRVGYGSNPFIQPGSGSGAGVLGFNINPSLQKTFATGATSLSGVYSREQYLNNLGHPDTAQVVLQHSQRFSPQWSMSASASYSTSTNALPNIGLGLPLATDPVGGVGMNPATGLGTNLDPLANGYIDPLTIGSRTRRVDSLLTINWQPDPLDSFSANGGYAHGFSNRSSRIGSYDFYSGGLTYTRSVGQRLHIGGRFGYSYSNSESFDSVSSYEPSFVLSYQFSEIWSFDGNVGATIRRIQGTGEKSTGLGFNANLCGKYPKTSLCVGGSRNTSASGFGGARINTNLSVNVTQQLTSRDVASLNVSYVDSKAVGGLNNLAQQFTQVNGGFDHKIGVRWLVGVDGRFQTRSQDFANSARAYNVTAHVGYLFGHIS